MQTVSFLMERWRCLGCGRRNGGPLYRGPSLDSSKGLSILTRLSGRNLILSGFSSLRPPYRAGAGACKLKAQRVAPFTGAAFCAFFLSRMKEGHIVKMYLVSIAFVLVILAQSSCSVYKASTQPGPADLT